MKREEIIAKWAGLSARERDAWVEAAVLPITEEEAKYRRKFRLTVPRYTTDISAAWPIFERYWSVELARISGPVDTYGTRINDSDGQIRAMSQEPSAPEALCLAALIVELTGVSANDAR
ncbi:BC1872 family protein [Paenibacillus graminis]|uniref:BC1872 family protein n=1 Tax=Paenibacillus graminis TaxID=189425 RepID=UPI00398A7DC4